MSAASSAKGPGRAEQASAAILRSALRLFTAQGFAATSIEQVAAAAGVGKHTIYRRHPTKTALFAAVLELQSDKMDGVIAKINRTHPNPLEALKELAVGLLKAFTAKEFIDFYRVCVAEARQPEVAKVLARHNVRIDDVALRIMLDCQEQGLIGSGDPAFLMRQLGMATIHYPFERLLIGQPEFASLQARLEYFERGWALFLSGARAQPVDPPERGSARIRSARKSESSR